jgi:hypothetical protein
MLLMKISAGGTAPVSDDVVRRPSRDAADQPPIPGAPSLRPAGRRVLLASRGMPAPREVRLVPTLVWGTAEALVGLADSLAALGCYEMARRRLEEARERFPVSPEPLRSLARLAERMGAHDQACRHWRVFLGQFAGMAGAEDRAANLRCLAYSKGGAYGIIDAADRASMQVPAIREAILSIARHRRWNALAALVDAAGQPADVDAADLPPEEPLLDESFATPSPLPPHLVRLLHETLAEGAPAEESHPEIAALPDGWSDVARDAAAAILAGDTEAALAAVGSLPADLIGYRVIADLLAWGEAQNDRLTEANRLLTAWHDRHYWPSFDAPLQTFFRLDSRPIAPKPDSVSVITVMGRDDSGLPRFLDHHRALGVERFIVIDNGLRRADHAFLATQADCHLFWTQDCAAAAGDGMRWVNHVLRRHVHDGWVAVLRADQRLRIPDGIAESLPNLARDLLRDGFEAVLAADPIAKDAAREGCAPRPTAFWMLRHPWSGPAESLDGPVVMAKARTVRFLAPGSIMPMRIADVALGLDRAV